jgi:hypothetical protein
VRTLPFDQITTPSTRAHLRSLPRLAALDLALGVLTPDLAALLDGLPHLAALTLRLPALHPSSLAPFTAPAAAPTEQTADGDGDDDTTPHWQRAVQAATGRAPSPPPADVVGDRRAPLAKLEVHAVLLHADNRAPLRALLAADPRLARVTTVFAGPADGESVVYAPTEARAVELALEEQRGAEHEEVGEGGRRGGKVRAKGEGGAEGSAAPASRDHWERTTNLRMFGGLIGLRMESRR